MSDMDTTEGLTTCPRCGRRSFDSLANECTSTDVPPCDFNDLKLQTEAELHELSQKIKDK